MLLLLWAAAPAASTTPAPTPEEVSSRITDLRSSQGSVQLLYSSSGLPDGVGVDVGSVTVSFAESGQEPVDLAADARRLGGEPELARQTAMLVVDVSGSLDVAGIAAVRDAATAFLDTVPDPVEVGLVTFGDPALVLLPPTTDHDAVRAAVDDLVRGGDTALYDAVDLAIGELPGEGIQRILLLTDGQDDGSDDTLEQAVAAVQRSGADLTAVSFGDEPSLQALQSLADAGSGRVVGAAEADDLAATFEAVAADIATDLVVEAVVPDELAGRRGNVVVTARAGDRTLQTAAFTTLAAPAPVRDPSDEPSEVAAAPAPLREVPLPDLRVGSPTLWAGLAGLSLALFTAAVVLVGLLGHRNSPEARRRRNLAIYSMPATPSPGLDTGASARTGSPASRLGDSAVARSAVELAERAVERRGATQRLARELESAGFPLRPGEWVVVHLASVLAGAVLLLLVSAGNPVAMLLGLLAGMAAPQVLLLVRQQRRRSAFLRTMPDTLGLMASGLRAGYSLLQAMDSVAREGQEPLRGEFNRALVEARLGVPPEDAMESIADRMGSQDFRWVVMAIRIQRDVGGNLAELLDTVAGTMRERARLRRQVDVLSAEGRLSAWIVGALPVGFTLYLLVVRPDYLRPLYTEPLGWVLLAAGSIAFAVGVLGLRWAVKVEV